MKTLSLAIVGTQFPNKKGPTRRFELELLKPGEPIELRPEPKNPADENAIAVYSCRGVQLGYVASVRAVLLIGQFKAGATVRAVFQGFSAAGPWIRATFDGSEPAVDLTNTSRFSAPRHRVAREDPDGDGFWPDPIYDD